MNSIYLKINDFICDLELTTLSMYFEHDIVEHEFENSGKLVIEIPKLHQFNEYVRSIEFHINESMFVLSNNGENTIFNGDTLEISYKDVFAVYDSFLKFIQNSIRNNYFKSSLMCFSTQLTCNLACSYCSVNCNSDLNAFIPSYDVCLDKICRIKNTLISNDYGDNIRYRIMGGETFLFPDIYEYSYNIAKKVANIINRNILYLYTNLLTNVDCVINAVERAKYDGFYVNLIASVDSFDIKYSSRFKTVDQIELFKLNLAKIRRCSNENCVVTVSVLSTNVIADILNTFKEIRGVGINNIKFGFDETKVDDSDLELKKKIINDIKLTEFNKYFSTSKLLVDDFLVINFNLCENKRFIFSTRTVNRVGHNIHKIYKHHDELRKFFKSEVINY